MATDKSLILNYHVGGFRQPRLSDGVTHPVTSIKADGTVTVFTKRTRTSDGKLTAADIDRMNKMDARYRRTAADMEAIGNVQ